MMAIKLNAQVIIKNIQNMHEKSLPPMGARRRMELEYQDRDTFSSKARFAMGFSSPCTFNQPGAAIWHPRLGPH
jgi:hypothetical protein